MKRVLNLTNIRIVSYNRGDAYSHVVTLIVEWFDDHIFRYQKDYSDTSCREYIIEQASKAYSDIIEALNKEQKYVEIEL